MSFAVSPARRASSARLEPPDELTVNRIVSLTQVIVKLEFPRIFPDVVLVNCQFDGRAHEDQPGFTLTLPKAVCSSSGSNRWGDFGARAVSEMFGALRLQLRPWRLKRRPVRTSIFFSMTPLPLRTGASFETDLCRRKKPFLKCDPAGVWWT